jgi:NDP-sugar pyrophosphorylase family protein
LIVQGDALFDLDLGALLDRNDAERRAMVTVAAQAVGSERVREFWIIATDRSGADGRSGRVVRFLEKPTLEQAGEHRLASTGIYVLLPEAYPLIVAAYDQKRSLHGDALLDFSRDVFPLVLRSAEGASGGDLPGMYASEVSGYWNDIGCPEQYFQGIADIQAGRVALRGQPLGLDVDDSGVVFWGRGRQCAASASASLAGNVLVVPTGNDAPSPG